MVKYLDWLDSAQSPEYRRLFYYTAPDHLISNLQDRCIKISDFQGCNDLFELASFDLKDREVRKRHRAWAAKCSSSVGLICFSEEWRNQLMWGHYALSRAGMGVCLVLDIKKTNLLPVTYVSRREEVSADFEFPPPSTSLEFRNACSKKSTHWGYENEQRYFVDLGGHEVKTSKIGLKFHSLGQDIRLVGIINGPDPRYSLETLFEAYGQELRGFQIRASFREFKMVVQQDQKLWKKGICRKDFGQ